MDWQVLVKFGLASLAVGGILYLGVRGLLFRARNEALPVNNVRFNWVGYMFFGLGVICWIGLSTWAALALGFLKSEGGRGQGLVPLAGTAVFVALVFRVLYVALQTCGVRFTKKIK